MKKFKNALIVIILISIAGGFIYYNYKTSQTILVDDATQGNTPGNLYNNGLFCENDDRIYFSNLSDDGALYSVKTDLSDYKKISSDKVVSINVTDPYIIYSRVNNQKEQVSTSALSFNNVGIYRINKNGQNLVCLDNTPVCMVAQHGNMVYFQHYDKANAYSLYSVTTEGKDAIMLEADPISPAMIQNQTLYFNGYSKDHTLYKKDLATNSNTQLLKNSFFMPIIEDETIFYLDPNDDYKLKSIGLDGTNPATLVDKRCSTYNLTNDGNYIYYQIDNQTENGIGCYDRKTGQITSILNGNYCNINITNNYVFFQQFNSATYYIVLPGSSEAKVFTPEVME